MRAAVRAAFALIIVFEGLAPFLLPELVSDFTWLGLAVTTAFAWGVVELFRLSLPVSWTIFVAIILDGVSALLELYSRLELWDLGIHAVGGIIIAIGSLELVLRALKENHVAVRRQGPFVAGTVYLFTATIGFLYEFWEYLVDKFQYGYPKSLVSAYDSVEDQVFNLLGATIVLILYYLWRAWKKRRTSPADMLQS